MKRERQSQISRINTTEFPGGRESNVAEPVCFPENSWLIRCANGAAFFANPLPSKLERQNGNHGFHGYTRMKKEPVCCPEKPRADSLHECRSCFEKALASELADAFL